MRLRKKKAEKAENAEPEAPETETVAAEDAPGEAIERSYAYRCPKCGENRSEPTSVGVVDGRPVCRECWEAR